MISLRDYLGCGIVSKYGDAVNFRVSKLKDLTDKIIPFFQKIVGVKSLDFQGFKKVVEIMRNGLHLTSEGIDQIRKIKAGMNRGRNRLL
jgi:hypothetical protein